MSALTPVVDRDTESAVAVEDEDSNDDEDYELDDIYVRTKFLESWLWTEVELPGAAGADGFD